jgi:hypothetical protein
LIFKRLIEKVLLIVKDAAKVGMVVRAGVIFATAKMLNLQAWKGNIIYVRHWFHRA